MESTRSMAATNMSNIPLAGTDSAGTLTRDVRGENRYIHSTCRNQLLALMFGQLSNRESLRNLVFATDAHKSENYHPCFKLSSRLLEDVGLSRTVFQRQEIVGGENALHLR